jgi:anti-anti-sigma factor
MRPESLGVRVSRDGDAWIVALPAEVRADVEDGLNAAGDQVLNAGAARIVVDLSAVVFANSAGVGALVVLVARARAKAVPLALAGPRGLLAVMLERSGLSGRAAMFDSVEAALSSPPRP